MIHKRKYINLPKIQQNEIKNDFIFLFNNIQYYNLKENKSMFFNDSIN